MAVGVPGYDAYTFNMCMKCGRDSVDFTVFARWKPYCKTCDLNGVWIINSDSDTSIVYVMVGHE